jgi:hypothetical protein
MFSRRTIRRPSTGRFHTAVCTVRPCQATSCGRPTFTDSKRPVRRSMITSYAPYDRAPPATSLETTNSQGQPLPELFRVPEPMETAATNSTCD